MRDLLVPGATTPEFPKPESRSVARVRCAAGGCLLALLVSPPLAFANEVGARSGASALIVHDAAETLRDYCVRDSQGILWFQLPGASRFELITSIDDPAISNRGDGFFHPFDGAEVRAALSEVRFPLDGITADVFILPYPRRYGLESAAGRGLILLSPGVRPLTSAHQHSEFVHELGHVVQYALLPDDREESWDAYRRLRGIEDHATYTATASHADRPHEIFAEDFRALFGGATANPSGTIENSRIAHPAAVGGLDRFLLELGGARIVESTLRVSSNPARGAVRFSRAGAGAQPLDLFDVTGRRLATLEPRSIGGAIEWRWEGEVAIGRSSVVFARVRGTNGGSLRLVLFR